MLRRRRRRIIAWIFLVTDTTNGRQYVGTSIQPLENRWKTVLGGTWKRPIVKAIRDHGWDNFTREVIEECSDSKRQERAAYWISFLNTVTPNGYNKHLYDKANEAKDKGRSE